MGSIRLLRRRLSGTVHSEIRHQHATRRLNLHRDDIRHASDASGIGGLALGIAGLLWILARCAPTILPAVFG